MSEYTSAFRVNDVDRHCKDCQHWDGWAPIRVGKKVDYQTHGLCANPKHCRVIAEPSQRCCDWVALPKAAG
jgi:hypothetical protein